MDLEAFTKLVQESDFLGVERQQDLIDNAPWMKNAERQQLAEAIGITKEKFDETDQEIIQMVDELGQVVETFKKEELPQIMQAEESAEHASEEEEAEKLLDNM